MEPKKILFVDDDPIVLDLFVKKFVKDNFRVDVAMSAAGAMDKLKKGFDPDAMIVDIKMPDMDGFELVAKMREDHLLKPEAKIIMFSSMTQDAYIQKAKDMNADGYIAKITTEPSEMMSQVKEILAGKKIFAAGM